MAYIDWWNRTKPITLGERFGLNEISTARETLSPIKSHTAESVIPSQFDEISLEEMEDIKKQVKVGPQVKDGGRIDMKPGGIVEPGVTHYGVTKRSELQTADTNKLINKAVNNYNKSILVDLKKGDLSQSTKFLEWARNNYNKETYTRIKSRYDRSILRPTHPLVKPLEKLPYNLQTMKKNLLNTLVDQANEGNRYVTKGALLGKVSTTGRLKIENPYEEIIGRLHKPKDKVHLAIDTLLKEPLFLEKSFQLPPGRLEIGYIYKNLMQETGLGDHNIKKYIKSHEKFKKIGAKETTKLLNFIQRSIAQKGPDRIKGWTLDELLEWGISRQGGRGRLTGLGKFGFLQLSKSPEMAAWNFVSRSFYNNAYWGDKGPIEFFDKNDKPLTFNDKINVKDHYFTYEGKKYDMGVIDRELGNWEKGKNSPFKNVFSNHRKMNEFLNKDVPHPTKKGATITMKELMQKAYGDRSIYMSLDHGWGVTKYPLKNIKVLGHRMNTTLGRVYKHYNDFPKIRKLLTDEIMSEFKGVTNANYLKALEKREYEIASKILTNKNSTIPSMYSEAAKNVFASKNYKNFNLAEKTKLATSFVPKEAQHKIKQPVFQSILEKDISGKQAYRQIENLDPKIQNLLRVAKNTPKGPGRFKIISTLITAGVGLHLLNKYGISSAEAAEAQTLEPDDKKHEASALSAVADKGWTKGEIAGGVTGTAVGTAIANYPKKSWELAKKYVGKPVTKLIAGATLPGTQIIPETYKAIKEKRLPDYDLTSPHTCGQNS